MNRRRALLTSVAGMNLGDDGPIGSALIDFPDGLALDGKGGL